ncbi:MAG: ribbon-helix-helix domain-containing protein [Candidatus Woesearchaeota archaeon]|nr:ribbon-helix-helix domain-containing protein [Candidatus Woesearchaeota archaeon]
MESITIKVDKAFAQEIDKAMHPHYSTKTEFIREAIRDKVKEIRNEHIRADLKKYFGKSKKKTPLHEDRRIREQVSKEYMKKRKSE